MPVISIEDLTPLKNKLVTVEIIDRFDSIKSFFYYGYLEEITDTNIKLRLQRKVGFKIINLNEIVSIKKRREGFNY